MYTTFKRIELESPGWSGFVENSRPDQLGLSSSIRLEVSLNSKPYHRCTFSRYIGPILIVFVFLSDRRDYAKSGILF